MDQEETAGQSWLRAVRGQGPSTGPSEPGWPWEGASGLHSSLASCGSSVSQVRTQGQAENQGAPVSCPGCPESDLTAGVWLLAVVAPPSGTGPDELLSSWEVGGLKGERKVLFIVTAVTFGEPCRPMVLCGPSQFIPSARR